MQDIEQLFLLYHQNLYHYLLSLTHDAAEAEDLTSETFCKALQSLAGFKEQSSAKTWLFSIARHLWLQQRRRHGREVKRIRVHSKLWGLEYRAYLMQRLPKGAK